MDITNIPHTPRIINVAGDDVLSRYEFALMIADIFQLDRERIVPNHAPSKAIAPRPEHAGLKVSLAKKLGITVKPVHEGLELMRHQWA
jgi:dTDP-4-dehydrorhamnose reductase